jgi:hypothetical protein
MGQRAFSSSQVGWLREAALRARPHDRAAARSRRRADRIRKRTLAAVLAELNERFPPEARVKLGKDGVPLGLEWDDSPMNEPSEEAGAVSAS